MSDVLVTGGAGFIGSHLVRHLANMGGAPTVLDNLSSGALGHSDTGGNVIQKDLEQFSIEDWEKVLTPNQTVYHLAAKKLNTPGVSDESLFATNLRSTIALARAAVRRGVRKIVFTSSLYVYDHELRAPTTELTAPNPRTLYGISKLAGEQALSAILADTEVKFSLVRLYFVYGPGQYPGRGYKSVIVKNFERILAGLPPQVCGSGHQALDYVFVGDVVNALIHVAQADSSGRLYNVGSGRATSISDLTRSMLEVADPLTREIEHLPADWTEGTSRSGKAKNLREEFGWMPRTSLQEGLEATWAALKDERAAF